MARYLVKHWATWPLLWKYR